MSRTSDGARMGGAELLRPRMRPLQALALLCLTRCAGADEGGAVKGTVKYLWPIHFSSVPLTTKGKESLESWELGEELARVGLAGHQKYMKTILPLELEADQEFAEEFRTMDHSRMNLAFNRWQKRVFSDTTGIPVEEISQRGEHIPKRLEGINYRWPELYNSSALKKLRRRIAELARLYNRRSGFPANSTADGPRYRIFPWVEAFMKGDALRPGSRTDSAYMMGRYFPAVNKGSLKLNFEDPRGINPPYGKTFSHPVFDGELVLYPTWVSHFITPNMHDSTVVCFCFLVYPEDGQTLAWKDDRSANLVLTRSFQASRKKVNQ